MLDDEADVAVGKQEDRRRLTRCQDDQIDRDRVLVACIALLEPLRQAAARGENLYFRIDPHWNAAGHRVAAEAIEAGLRGMGLLDPGK